MCDTRDAIACRSVIVITHLLTAISMMVEGRPFPSNSDWAKILGKSIEISTIRDVKLYSVASGRHLTVYGSWIDGKGTDDSEYTHLRLENVGFNRSRVRIKGTKTNNYVCFDDHGHLIGKPPAETTANENSCVFQKIENKDGYFNFRSVKNKKWWIAIRKNGEKKPWKRINTADQKAIQFIVRQL